MNPISASASASASLSPPRGPAKRHVVALAEARQSVASPAADPLWRWSNPAPHGNHVYAMGFYNESLVHVGERGRIHSTVDFANWIPRSSGTDESLRDLAVFDDRLLVTGSNGTILHSTTLTGFAAATLEPPTTDWIEGVAVAPDFDLAVAVGDNGAVYTSADGSLWEHRPQPFDNWLTGVAFGGDRFVAVGFDGFIATSSRGVDWSVRDSATAAHLRHVSFVGDRGWAVGDEGTVRVSDDAGVTWTAVDTGATGRLNAVAGTENEMVVAGVSEVRIGRRNGEAFSWLDALDASHPSNPSPPPDWTYLSLLHFDNEFMLGGRSGMTLEGLGASGSDFLFWFPLEEPVRNWIWDTTRIENFYLSVGDFATVMTSHNGIQWDIELVPEPLSQSIFLGVGGNTNMLVVAGNGGSLMVSTNRMVEAEDGGGLVSTLGIDWDAVEPRPSPNDLQGVCVFEDTFIVTGGEGTILTSVDGISWIRQLPAPTASFLSGVASHPTGLVAVGDNGTILSSDDGTTWTPRESGTSDWIYKVRHLNESWVAVGQNGLLLTSTDGASWTRRETGTSRWLNDVTWSGAGYLTVGTQGTVLTSPDLENWRDVGTATHKSLYSASQFEGQVLIAGVEGAIIRAQVVPRPEPVVIRFTHDVSQDQVATNRFGFAGVPDQRFRLERTENLSDWIPIETFEFLNGDTVLLYTEEVATPPSREYYRAVSDRR